MWIPFITSDDEGAKDEGAYHWYGRILLITTDSTKLRNIAVANSRSQIAAHGCQDDVSFVNPRCTFSLHFKIIINIIYDTYAVIT